MKKNKFKMIWKTQSEIGVVFGISAIAVGKHLTNLGLKDGNPTELAISSGFVHKVTDKRGQDFFMWNLSKVKDIFAEKLQLTPKSKESQQLSKWVKEYKKIIKEDKLGNEKISIFALEELTQEVEGHGMTELFTNELKKLKLI